MFNLFLYLVFSVFAQSFQPTKNSLTLINGWAQPLFGDFGDFEKGFKGNLSYGILYLRDYDDLVSYGFQMGETFFLKNRPTGLRIKFFSALPVVALKSDYKKNGMVYFGIGIFHWSSPSKDNYLSSSDDEFGFRLGYGRTILDKRVKFSIGFEWSYIIGVKGINFDLGNINIFNPYFSLRYEFK